MSSSLQPQLGWPERVLIPLAQAEGRAIRLGEGEYPLLPKGTIEGIQSLWELVNALMPSEKESDRRLRRSELVAERSTYAGSRTEVNEKVKESVVSALKRAQGHLEDPMFLEQIQARFQGDLGAQMRDDRLQALEAAKSGLATLIENVGNQPREAAPSGRVGFSGTETLATVAAAAKHGAPTAGGPTPRSTTGGSAARVRDLRRH